MTEYRAMPSILELRSARFIPGFVHGRHQPSLLVGVKLAASFAMPPPPHQSDALGLLWQSVTGTERVFNFSTSDADCWQYWIQTIFACALALLRAAELPLFDEPRWLRLLSLEEAHADWSYVLLPVMPGRPEATWQVCLSTVQLFDNWAQTNNFDSLRFDLIQSLVSLRKFAPQGGNTPRFLRAAQERGIPVTALGQDIFQFGHGNRSQWLDSTFTLRTANISARLARDKQATAARLRQAGLPVADHQPVTDGDEAVRVANRLGYPVVIKPADQDGGIGVAAGLVNDSEVKAAFEQARKFSERILVEKHVLGRDYRLTVLDGELLWAIERTPAGVTGDGIKSIDQLVDQENADPQRGEGPHAVLKRILLDDEAREMLHKQYSSTKEIPPKGHFVQLRRIANITTGGRPIAVYNLVHPDNVQIAVRAAEALRLDLAGVDLLIPDIARSWQETGAAICEVNAQPQLGACTGPHLYGEILHKRLRGDGRIPVVVVVGAKSGDTLLQDIVLHFRENGQCVGWFGEHGAGIDDTCLIKNPSNMFAAGQMLVTNPRVSAIVLGLNTDEVLHLGLPLDRISCLVLAGKNLICQNRTLPLTNQMLDVLFNEIFACISLSCINHIIHLSDSNIMPIGLDNLLPVNCSVLEMDRKTLLMSCLTLIGNARHTSSLQDGFA